MGVIKKFTGGLISRIEAAIRDDGVIFIRTQRNTRWGYKWSSWKKHSKVNPQDLPDSLVVGFSTLTLPTIYTDFKVRLPKN